MVKNRKGKKSWKTLAIAMLLCKVYFGRSTEGAAWELLGCMDLGHVEKLELHTAP